jgi:hypothetical protein
MGVGLLPHTAKDHLIHNFGIEVGTFQKSSKDDFPKLLVRKILESAAQFCLGSPDRARDDDLFHSEILRWDQKVLVVLF